MGALSSWMRGRKALASGVVLAVLAGVPVSLAVLHPGYPVTDVNLNTRNVWVTNGKSLLGGRINHQIGELDAKVNGSSGHLDVLQDGGATLLTDASQGTVQVIDPAFVSLTEKITVPVGAQLAYGGDTLAILSTEGRLWLLDTSTHLTFDQRATAPVAKLGTNAQVTVSKSGMAFAVSPSSKKLLTIQRPGAAARTAAFPALKRYQLSAVGDKPVVLDTSANTLVAENGSAEKLPAEGLRIQQAGPESDSALIATADGLLEVPLNGDKPRVISAQLERAVTAEKDVSAPVYLNGCAYGAWAGAQKYLYACTGSKPIAQNIEQAVQGDDVVFRVNHGVIALNNVQDGNAWIVSSNMRLVNNWAQVNPDQVTRDGDKGKERPVKASFEDAVAHRTTVNQPPVAVPDTLGVRPNRTTILPVLSNDTDADGDVLTITRVDPIEARQGRLDVIDGGRAVQFTPAATASSTVSFKYTITDGRRAYATAQVNVTLRPTTLNAAPVMTRTSTTTLEVGQSIQYNVVNDWIDPDGDAIYLVGAASTTADAVQFTPDGFVTFTSKTGQTGAKKVAFTISDGRVTATGTLDVNVKAADSLDPVAVPDFATALSGEPAVIHPLQNDLSPAGSALSLLDAKLSEGEAAAVSVDSDRATISLHSETPGTFYLTYTLAAGSHTTRGVVRVDVTEPPASKTRPIAVKDTAYVRPGEPTTVNVLDNDVSPSGRVLVVQSVAKGADAENLNVEVLANAVVRVTSPGVLDAQLQLNYTISDGYSTSTAGITVVPIPPLVNHQPLVAEDDTATVRAGDVVSVPVLANDSSPDNEPFTLDAALKDVSKAGAGGTAFVSDSLVRYQAPRMAGTYSVSYGITDKFTQTAAATLTFTVTADGEKNRPPQPEELTARAFAGSAVEVVIPLDGIDPDGDSVTLDGIASAPTLGRVADVTTSSFTYQAYPTSLGTERFNYTVRDVYGATATGTVNIGVVPRPTALKPPTAVDDRVEVKPGKVASVPVLLNDSDPNGFVISLLPKLPEVQAPLKAKVSGGNVLVTAPPVEGAYVIRYQISNGQGGSATAFIQVLVTKDATPIYPTAADHILDVQQVTKKANVPVDVLDGAHNPSGLAGELKIAVEGENAGAASVGGDGTVSVRPSDHRLAITYSLTDTVSGLAGRAFIIVPAKPGSKPQATKPGEKPKASKPSSSTPSPAPVRAPTAPPHIKADLAQQVVTMNGEKTWKLSDIVDVPSGRPAKLSGSDGASATNSTVTPYQDAQSLIFKASKDFRGPAAITFEVNDGRDDGATADRLTLLTLPITVGSADQSDIAPTFTPPVMKIEAGEKAQTIDLRDSSYHPNPKVLEQLSYTGLKGATTSVAASLSGSMLTISSPLGVQPGTTAKLSFTMKYKNFSVPGSVKVTVVSSTRPVASQKSAPQQRELRRGAAGGVTLSNAVGTDYWINPFPAKPLVIVSAKAVSAPNGVTVSNTGSSITMKAGTAASTGRVNIQYVVQDATKDKQRNQIGQLTVTIHDVPDAPPAPSNAKATDAQATMSIAAPRSDNGKTVTRYSITWSGGSGTLSGPGTFTAKGLTNGSAYRFTVRAVNSDGSSAPSAASASVIPYGTPSAPSSARITKNATYAPMTLHMAWGASKTSGGGTVSYRHNFNGEGWSGWTTAMGANTRSVTKGTYKFQVQARNNGSGKTSTPVTSGSVTIANKPPDPPKEPSASVVKGASVNGMHYLCASYANVPRDSYLITPLINGASGWAGSRTRTLSGSGTICTTGYLGKRNSDVISVKFSGKKTFSATTSNWDSLPATGNKP